MPFIVPPRGVYSRRRGFRPTCLSVCLSLCQSAFRLTPSPLFSFPLYYYYYYGAALYNPRNKSYLKPETNYHYGNSLLNSTQPMADHAMAQRRSEEAEAERAPASSPPSVPSPFSANAMIRFPRQLCGVSVCLSTAEKYCQQCQPATPAEAPPRASWSHPSFLPFLLASEAAQVNGWYLAFQEDRVNGDRGQRDVGT